MRKRIKRPRPVYSSGTRAKQSKLCSTSQTQPDKYAAYWERIRNEYKALHPTNNQENHIEISNGFKMGDNKQLNETESNTPPQT